MRGEDGWRKVGGYVRAERKRRRQTQPEFAADVGISPRLLTDLETAARDNYDDGTIAVVEDLLGWEPGSLARVVAGAAPRPRRVDPQLARLHAAWVSVPPDGRVLLADLAEFMGSSIGDHGTSTTRSR